MKAHSLFLGLNLSSCLYGVFAMPPAPDSLWAVSPPLDYDDPIYAGWKQIPIVKEIQVYNGIANNRTYAHHPELFAVGSNVYLIFSSAPVDEDSMGQDVWISTSNDGGLTWSRSESLLPAAILPNQTDNLQDYTYWCSRGIAQRAWQGLTFVHLDDGELYAIGQSGSRWCPGSYRTAGRIAHQISLKGKPIGDPCWIEKNEYTSSELYNETIYGTKYGMRGCKRACDINKVLRQPDKAPAWSPWLYNHILDAADGVHSMQENTFAVWFHDSDSPTGGYWQRHWRDISSGTSNTHNVWVEYNEDPNGNGWYPKRMSQLGNNIYQTTIPDAGTKQFLWKIYNGNRYLISNPRYTTLLQRQPLTLATSVGRDQRYTSVGVLRTNATTNIVPDTRGVKAHAFGFSYPTAVQVGNKLIAAYSENKENIWVSVVNVEDLPLHQ